MTRTAPPCPRLRPFVTLRPQPSPPALARHRAFIAARRAGPRPVLPGTAIARVLLRLPTVGASYPTWLTLLLTARSTPPAGVATAVRAPGVAPTVTRVLHTLRERQRHTTVYRRDSVLRQTLRERVREAIVATVPALPPMAPGSPRADARPAFPRLPTVVTRSTPGRSDPGRSPATAAPTPAGPLPTTSPPSAAPPPVAGWPLTPPTLAQLTQAVSAQVVGQLERRALSFRERRG